MGNSYAIAVIPGDGVGREVIPVGCEVLRAVATVLDSFDLHFEEFSWSSEYYLRHGSMMPPDALQTLEAFDAIYVGAVGLPGVVAEDVAVGGLTLAIRKGFDQYVNLRPLSLLPGIPGALRGKGSQDIDLVCVRENTEGEYVGAGGRIYRGTLEEVALQTSVVTRRGAARVIRYAFEVAHERPRKKVTSVTKSNVLLYSMGLWDEVFEQVAREYPEVEAERRLVDALAARLITHPESLDVVVASNLFGDILTDLGAALVGGLGVAPSANLNPGGHYPAMFEPVHGSAPDIAGRGIANPIAAVWAGSMMLDVLGEKEGAETVMEALRALTWRGDVLTPDLGGRASTGQVGAALCASIRERR